MRRTTLLALLTTILLCSPALAEPWAQKMFADVRHDFGTIARGAKAEFEFSLKNTYVEDVRIADVRVSCGCTSVWIKDNKRVLKTYETATIVAHINSATFLGGKGATITVMFDKPLPSQAQLHVSAYIRKDVVFQPSSVELGSVDQGTVAERTIRITFPGRSDLRLLGARSTNPHVSGELTRTSSGRQQTAYDLRVRLGSDVPAGYVKDHLVLTTNDPRRSHIPVLVEGHVVSDLAVSPQWLLLGTVEPGQKVSKMVIVRGKTPFRIIGITSQGNAFQLAAPTGQSPKWAHAIPVMFVAGDEPGKIERTIYIKTDQREEPVRLTARAVVTAPPTTAGEIDEEQQELVAQVNESPVQPNEPPVQPIEGTSRASAH